MAISLELVKGQTAASVEPKRAVLTDAFISDLYTIFQQRATMQRVADSTLIKTRLLRTATRILGPGVVQAVLIEKLFEQPS